MAELKLLQFTIFLVFLSTLQVQTKGLKNSRILDDLSPPDLQNKCGNCPCDNPCSQPPPPPSPPPPSPPPPPKKKPPPPSDYCPPPPSGDQYPPNPPYIYISGPPGNLYPVDADFSGSYRSSYMGILPFLISSAVGLLATSFLGNHH